MPRLYNTVPILMRLGPSLVAATLYLCFALLWRFDLKGYLHLEFDSIYMLNPQPYPDLRSILTAGECWRQGVNVYAPSACMHGGIFNYSPFLLRFAYFGLTAREALQGGVLMGALFIGATTLLPPARTAAEFGLRALALCSSSVIYALLAGNFDTIVFLLVLAGVLLLDSRHLSALGYAVFLFAAACKFYPAVLLSLLLRERAAVVLAVGVLGAIFGGIFLWHYAHALAAALSVIPAGLPFRCVFGALNLPFGLSLIRYLPFLTLEPNVPEFYYAVDHPVVPVIMDIGKHVVEAVSLLGAFMSAPRYAETWRAEPPRYALFFITGAIAIVFCYFAAQNLSYRCLFLLLLLPGLNDMAGSARGKVLLAGVLFLLWEEFFRHLAAVLGTAAFGPERAVYPEMLYWVLREFIWWWVIIQLGAFIICFARQNLARLVAEALPAPANV